MRSVPEQLLLAVGTALLIIAAWIAGATAVLGLIDDLGDTGAWFWTGVALAALLGAVWCVKRFKKPA